MSAPLAGVRVLDLSRLIPGPFASLVLADLGAQVDKVEDLGAGDYLRHMPPQVGGHHGQSRYQGGQPPNRHGGIGAGAAKRIP